MIASCIAGVHFVLLILAVAQLFKEQKAIRELGNKFYNVIESNKRVSGELASVRVKHGQAWETFIPMMSKFEEELGHKQNATFLGQPIDFIYFNEDEIVFVEVKTGNSKLSSGQRRIRKLVKDKRVRWAEVNDTIEKEPDA